MISITIAGAGAGKTYSVAEKTLESLNLNLAEHIKKHFALTYTNTAKEVIYSEVLKQSEKFPKRLQVSTVHSFLLEEIIFPYSYIMLGVKYRKASTEKLSSEPKYKNKRIRELKDLNIIHVDAVYSVAKSILDINSSRNRPKKRKVLLTKIYRLIESYIGFVIVDEVQDLDSAALDVFKYLGNTSIDVHLIGDPKQAIKHPSAFIGLIKKHSAVLTINKITRRLPESILYLSNEFCPENQRQETISEIKGSVNFISTLNSNYYTILQRFIDDKHTLVYIDKKKGSYLTTGKKVYSFPSSVEDKIKKSANGYDEEVYCRAVYRKFISLISEEGKPPKIAINFISKNFIIGKFSNPEYAMLSKLGESISKNDSGLLVNSIDSIKGMEANTCVFIISENMYKYLMKINIDKQREYNKEWNKMYVALTRTKKDMIFAIDESLFKKFRIESVISRFEKLGIRELIE